MALGGFTAANYPYTLSSPVNGSGLFSMWCWFWDPNANATQKCLCGNTDGGNANNYQGLEVISGTVRFAASSFSGRVASSNTYSVNTWNAAGGVHAGMLMRSVYLNNVKTSNVISLSPSGYSVWATGIRRNTAGTTAAPATNLIIGEVAGWNAALTDEDFDALYKGTSPQSVRPESLAIYTPYDGKFNNLWGTPLSVVGSPTLQQSHPRIYK